MVVDSDGGISPEKSIIFVASVKKEHAKVWGLKRSVKNWRDTLKWKGRRKKGNRRIVDVR